ncbi:tail fiber assembly protein [Morganella morganii]|nr:tail fiber assembly protein [Morganella morganii]
MVGVKIMKYYKNKDGVIYALNDDELASDWIKSDVIEITERQADILRFSVFSNDDKKEIYEYKKQSLITEANQKTQLWQTQLMLGIITDEDKASLTEWMLYVQKVQAVDTSTAPDIIWPEKPE